LKTDTCFAIPRNVEGCVDLGTAVMVCSSLPRLHIAVALTTILPGTENTFVLMESAAPSNF